MNLPGNLGARGKRQFAKRFLESDQGAAVLEILAEAEATLVRSVREQQAAIGVDLEGQPVPSKEDRKAQLQEMILAKIEGRFPEWWVETPLADRIDHADEAAEFADVDESEWTDAKETWADVLRESNPDADVDELADVYTRRRFGLELEEFREVVVEWPDGREAAELREILVAGVQMANQGINYTTTLLEAADVQVDVDELQEDLEGDDVEISTAPDTDP
jgi:hypothetical protein